MDFLKNLEALWKFLGSNRFYLDDAHTLTIELKDGIVFTVNEKTVSEMKVILEGSDIKIHIKPAKQSLKKE